MLKSLLQSKTVIQFLKFLLVGGSAFLIDFSINLLVINILNMEIKTESAVANVISYSIALIYNYMLSSRWSFRERSNGKQSIDTMVRFLIVNLFNLTWSSIAIWSVVGIVQRLEILPSENLVQPFTKILVTSVMTIVSFVLYRVFVFKSNHQKEKLNTF